MREMMTDRKFVTKDLYLAAYIILTTNTYPTFEKKEISGKVLLSFPSSAGIYRALQDYNEGAKADAAEFARTIKALRSETMKAKFSGVVK
jgi:hypothetical protein